VSARHVQLLVYRFAASARLEGHLVGALERMEAGGAMRLLDLLIVGSDAATGERFALDMPRGGAGGVVASLLGVRLDSSERQARTRRTLTGDGARAELAGALADALPAGAAAAVLLIAHEWERGLGDAVARTGGNELHNAFVEHTALTSLAPEVIEAVAQTLPG
jgi:hypothetical protein